MINPKPGSFQIFTYQIRNHGFLAAIGQSAINSIQYEQENKKVKIIKPAKKIVNHGVYKETQYNQFFTTYPVG